MGDSQDAATRELESAAAMKAHPGAIVVTGPPVPDAAEGPFANRPMLGGRPTAYVCRGSYCYPPVTTPEEVAALLGHVPSVR